MHRKTSSFQVRSVFVILALASLPECVAAGRDKHLTVPELDGRLSAISRRFAEYTVILRPDKQEPEWWAGAPSVVRDEDGVFWMACRMRTADSPRGLRGYEVRLLRSQDGIHFEKVHSILREDVPIGGFERPALLIEPGTKKFKLYVCGPWKEGRWCILKFDDVDEPSQFNPPSVRAVIEPIAKSYERDVMVDEYKDPFIIHAEGGYHCYVIGIIRRTERIFHFYSEEGEHWSPVGNAYESVMDLTGWHDFYVRPASVVPLKVGYLFVYEGSNVSWYDPVYNIATGLAFTFDLHNMIDLTREFPLAVSTTPGEHFSTWRYSHWIEVDGELWVYAEVACPQGYNEIRLFRLRSSDYSKGTP